MDIQKLMQKGYSLLDIQEMLALFVNNLNSYRKIFTHNNKQQILLDLHKLKGGLILLEFSQLSKTVYSIECNIKINGVMQSENKLVSLLEDCINESNVAVIQLEKLILKSVT